MRQEVRIVLGDCVEKMKEMGDGTAGSIICDPPYGIEFMGKKWDDLTDWQSGGGFTKPGIGDRKTAWPSFGGDTTKPTCSICGGRKRGAKKCDCDVPDWYVKGEKYNPQAKKKSRNALQQELSLIHI